jgi:hypothetical protein
MSSPLDFPSSEIFRKKLVVRNLVPYKKSPSGANPPINYETILRDLAPTDSPDELIDLPTFANNLYPLNQYGQWGGYTQVRPVNTLRNTRSNEGEYGFDDADKLEQGYQAALQGFPGIQGAWKPLNAYASTDQLSDSAAFFATLEILQQNNGRSTNAQPYPNFNPSSYSAISLLLQNDPLGSNGLLSNDSYLAKLGSGFYKLQVQKNIQRQIEQETIGRANFLNVNGGEDIYALLTGRVPLLEPNYTITVSPGLVGGAAQIINRLSGTYAPFSTIPGDYFQTPNRYNSTIQQIAGAYAGANLFSGIGRFFARLGGSTKSGSELFLENTGTGQKSILFRNLEFNQFKPGYTRTFFDRVAGVLRGATEQNSDYYIGSVKSEPSNILSPIGDLPVDALGREVKAPVYGPNEISELYEGPSKALRLGANGSSLISQGSVEGGFTWVSPKFKGNAGKYVGPGGNVVSEDPDFNPAGYQPTESTNFSFKQGSILDDTQRLIDSQPRGGRRLQHVGNAIDQVSKVFNDGYKEITKGSKVIKYVGEIGQERGAEYCRIFTKDTPYLQYNDLQKTDGMTTQGRKFSYSILDNTYNLNIAPNKMEGGQASTNLIPGIDGYAKKYMFSIENLAWRTSNRPGYTWADLPVCERGPNGGRVMWFPPYGLTFNENVRAGFKTTDFIGRPEPVYTYNNTSRTGSLTWKIVVDHPSVLNMIVNRVLSNETTRSRVDSILDSFFAGCRKYDLYELAQRYYTINPNDLFEIQKKIQYKDITTEEVRYLTNTIQTGDAATSNGGSPGGGNTNTNSDTSQTAAAEDFQKYISMAYYFDNDIPKPRVPVNPYQIYYNAYTSSTTKQLYQQNSNQPNEVSLFFTEVIEDNKSQLDEMLVKIGNKLKNSDNVKIELELESSASSPASDPYNFLLSQRRMSSVVQYITGFGDLNTYIGSQLFLVTGSTLGENASVTPISRTASFRTFQCSSRDVGDSLSQTNDKIYSVNAMACRRTAIKNINVKEQAPVKQSSRVDPTSPRVVEQVTSNVDRRTVTQQVVTDETVLRDNITKRVLRNLLNECDYFEVIKQETPMLYDNLKEKLKYFHPAFHSITPEGLNSRLTFLQQCMRPGDTIPTVSVDKQGNQTLQYNNAVNTGFGTPPILVLRVGDFWHSKIVPESLQIQYEGLDLNPEGIGVQPMIANITLSFSFVGGQGLKESVDKLQNALSFNYYANTEVYDDRADATDTSYQILDKEFIQALNIEVPPPTINQVENYQPQGNLETIGKILTSNVQQTTTTGTIEYKGFMNNLVGGTQTYFTTIVSKNKDVLRQYNNGVRQSFALTRRYTNGAVLANGTGVNIPLYGKPSTFEKTVNNVFSDYLKNIQNETDAFIVWLSDPSKNFNKKVIRQVKDNMTVFVKQKQNEFSSGLSTIIQGITDTQTTYVKQLARANTVPFFEITNPSEGTDGLQQTNGNVIVYSISGTTDISPASVGVTNTWQEMTTDIQKVAVDVKEYYDTIFTKFDWNSGSDTYSGYFAVPENQLDNIVASVFSPFTTSQPEWNDITVKRQYYILSKDVVDDNLYERFKNAIIQNIVGTTLLNPGNTAIDVEFDAYWKGKMRPIFVKENQVTEQFMNAFEKEKLPTFLVYTPFTLEKKRVLTYRLTPSPSESQIQLIKNLGLKNNSDNSTTNWGVVKGNVITSKAQLL